ncbi:MAG: hypothetical protein C0399_04600 [Syntrophus sp. (in: bacteria)]|nr:hypothetical protein [Syntrophus sp. (in: bacteria)]
MSKIAIDKLEPGMRLAKPVENASGMVLIGENTELTDDLISRIKGMDVDSVYIQGMSKPSVPIEVMLAALDERFKMAENEPHMDILKKIFREHIEGLYG